MPVKIDTSAFDAFATRVEQAMSGPPMQEALSKASNAYHEAMRQRFRAASNRDGTWEPLRPRTVAEHKKIGDDPPHTLHLTGDMELSLRRGEVNHVLEVNENSVIEGTEDPKARYHQDGGGNLPAREILVDPNAEVLDAMKRPLVAAVQNIIRGDSETLDASESELGEIFDIDLI